MSRYDKLNGGSVARLAHYRRELARSLETIRGCRTPEAAAEFIENAGYTSALNHRYSWQGDAHGIGDQLQRAKAERRGYVSAPWGLVDGWRDIGDAGDIVTLRHTGWYSDADASETYRGHVWQLPARDGSPRYVAGYVEDQGRIGNIDGTRASGYVMLECERGALVIYDEKEDAARAGDALAERMAEDSREYSERWQEASRANDKREDAREALKDARTEARDAIAALREISEAPTARRVLLERIKNARGEMRDALREIATQSEKIEDLNMSEEF